MPVHDNHLRRQPKFSSHYAEIIEESFTDGKGIGDYFENRVRHARAISSLTYSPGGGRSTYPPGISPYLVVDAPPIHQVSEPTWWWTLHLSTRYQPQHGGGRSTCPPGTRPDLMVDASPIHLVAAPTWWWTLHLPTRYHPRPGGGSSTCPPGTSTDMVVVAPPIH